MAAEKKQTTVAAHHKRTPTLETIPKIGFNPAKDIGSRVNSLNETSPTMLIKIITNKKKKIGE
ncbi:MAG: hypothetical protein KA242_07945, partial [Chitinophagales bacterium]|nr:hypothetical protein [Chitinophagales bacterium]